jgi:hypothetical protein
MLTFTLTVLFPFFLLFLISDLILSYLILVNLMNDLLQNCQQILTEIENYHGCGNKIKDALSNSTNSRLQILAYNEVCPNIEIISQFYNLANRIGLQKNLSFISYLLLGTSVIELSNRLTNVEEVQTHLSELTVLGELVLFCFKFDQLKVISPPASLLNSSPFPPSDVETRDSK